MNKEQILGVNVSPLTYDGVIGDLKQRMVAKEKSTIIAVNPEKFIAAGKDEKVKELINSSTYQIPDGIGVIIASKLKGGQITSRVTGVDMMERLLKFAAEENHPIFMYGAKEEVVQKAMENIKAKFQGITIAGYTNGYEKDMDALVQRINDSKAEILFVALGSPRQELWIRDNMSKLTNVLVFQGVGGSFDVFAGHVKRAPKLFRQLGLEWFYRLITDPKRFKRQLALPRFLLKVIFQSK